MSSILFNATANRLTSLTVPQNQHCKTWRWDPVRDGWLIRLIEQSFVVGSSIRALRLSFGSRLNSIWMIMAISGRLWLIRDYGSPKWKFWIWFSIGSLLLLIACSASLVHLCSFNILLRWLQHWRLQLFIVRSLNMPLEEGYRYVFSTWLSRYILCFTFDQFYSGIHCTQQSHVSGLLLPPASAQIDARIGTSQSRLALLATISFHTQFILCQHSSTPIGTPQLLVSGLALLYFTLCSVPPLPILYSSIHTGAPWSGQSLIYLIQHSVPPPPVLALFCWNWCSPFPTGATQSPRSTPIAQPGVLPLIIRSSSICIGTVHSHSVLLSQYRCASTWFRTLYPSLLVLLNHDLHSSIPICAPLPRMMLF